MLELGRNFIEIAPRFRVLPMGFSWAFHLAHVAHEELATQSLPGIPFIRDRQPFPDLIKATAILVYADNCDHMGPDQVVVDSNRVKMSTHVIFCVCQRMTLWKLARRGGLSWGSLQWCDRAGDRITGERYDFGSGHYGHVGGSKTDWIRYEEGSGPCNG